MTMRTKTFFQTGRLAGLLILSAAAFTVAAAAGAAAAAEPFNPYHPAALNEAAMQKLRAGDPGTAALLLERAALLAPHDATIRRNLQTLRAWRAGQPLPATDDAAVTANASAPQAGDAGPELPPFTPWPAK